MKIQKFIPLFFILLLSIISNGQEQSLGTKITKIKIYNYNKTQLLSTATIDGGWSTRGDKIRIDYGLMNYNRSLIELQIQDAEEIEGDLRMICKDTGSGEKLIVYLKEDPENKGKPILEIRINSSQQTLQFLHN